MLNSDEKCYELDLAAPVSTQEWNRPRALRESLALKGPGSLTTHDGEKERSAGLQSCISVNNRVLDVMYKLLFPRSK